MASCINCPIRIGRVSVFPGDLVLGKREGVIFIPAHLAEKVIINSEFIALRDKFGIQRLKEGKYTPGQIDQAWTREIKDDFLIPSKDNDINYIITGDETNFQQNILSSEIIIKDEDYFRFNLPSIQNSYLLVNYIYLDNAERFLFINNEHEYLVPVVQNIQEQTFYSTNISYKIPYYNPIKIIFWRAQLLSNYISNDLFNYTLDPIVTVSNKIIEYENIVINSINRMELNKPEYYTYIQVYQNNFVSPQDGIHMFSFGINPLEYQPSGTLNFSKIDDAFIKINSNKLVNYQNPILLRSYGIQLNLFRVINGLGGLGYYA